MQIRQNAQSQQKLTADFEKECEEISLFKKSGKLIKLSNFCLMTCQKVVFTS